MALFIRDMKTTATSTYNKKNKRMNKRKKEKTTLALFLIVTNMVVLLIWCAKLSARLRKDFVLFFQEHTKKNNPEQRLLNGR